MKIYNKCDGCGWCVDKELLEKSNPYSDHMLCPSCWNYANSPHPEIKIWRRLE